jgi:acyl-CoA thioester hydrolase
VLHEHSVQLRWSDPDSLGHVNHARALSLIEDARTALLGEGDQFPLILARLEVDYLRQLYYRVGERLVVRSHVVRLGGKSFTIRQELIQDDEVAIRADVVMVTFDFDADTSRPISDAERARWSRYIQE